VKVIYQTVEWLKEARQARVEAQSLLDRTTNLSNLLQNVDSIIQLRKADCDRDPNRLVSFQEKEIIGTLLNVFNSCKSCIEELHTKLLGLDGNKPMKLPTQVKKSVQFTLSKKSIQKFERMVDTNIQAVSASLGLLQLLDQRNVQERLEKLNSTLEDALAHLRHMSTMASPEMPTSPQLEKSLELNTTAPLFSDSELLGIKTLEQTINTARSVATRLSSDGSTALSESEIADVREEIIVDESALEQDLGDQPLGTASDITENEHRQIAEPISGLGINIGDAVLDMGIDDDESEYPTAALIWEMPSYVQQADKEFEAEHYSTAEKWQEKAIRHGETLERRGERPFTEQVDMSKRLADIYMKQDKYAEAARIIQLQLQQVEKDRTLEYAMLSFLFAKISFAKYEKNKREGHHDAAERDLDAAAKYGISKCFAMLHTLTENSTLDENDGVFLDCIQLIVRILEEEGDTVAAQSWRERWLGASIGSGVSLKSTVTRSSNSTSDHRSSSAERIRHDLYTGRTPLINSIIFDHHDEFQELLDLDASVEGIDEDGLTPLMHAAGCQHTKSCSCVKVIRKLKDRDVDLHKTLGNTHETALHRAVAAGNAETIHIMLEIDAGIDASAPNTPLACAVKRNQADVVKQLLDAGADMAVLDLDNWTLLHHAVASYAYDTVLTLLHRSRKEVNALTSTRKTPLMIAADRAGRRESCDIARELIRYGADVNAQDSIDRTPLYITINATYTIEREQFVNLLLDMHADVEAVMATLPRRCRQYSVFAQHVSNVQRRDSLLSRASQTPSTRTRNSLLSFSRSR
jgi:ankyrin repeat protein